MKTRILSYFVQCITATIACAVDGCYCNTFSHGSNYRVFLQTAPGINKCDNILFQNATGIKKRQKFIIIKDYGHMRIQNFIKHLKWNVL